MKDLVRFAKITFVAAAAVITCAQPLLAAAQLKPVPICGTVPAGRVRCLTQILSADGASPLVSADPQGFGPAAFRSAYGVSGGSSSAVIAVVDAYDDPHIKSDLDVFDKTFGLASFPSCNTKVTKSCFKKVDQNGGSHFPKTNSGWSLETALDVETIHGICPTCTLVLVEAKSASMTDIMMAVDQATNQGADVVSNSYGGSESSDEINYDRHFDHKGVAFIASSGDSGYGVSYPAASPFVTAVGGTKLSIDGSGDWLTEVAWSGSGSGCSAYEAKPAYQSDSSCKNRMVADVSADADPAAGAAVYSSVSYQGQSGWFKVGGTSLAAPLVAGLYGQANNIGRLSHPASRTYQNAKALHDVTDGNNGSCRPKYYCHAGAGYDGPSGLGSPKGLTAF